MKCTKCRHDNHDDAHFCENCGAQIPPLEKISVYERKASRSVIKKLSTGSIFAGRYRVIVGLGKGGMGEVYKVIDKEIKEKVALKLINPEVASDKRTIERFRNELKFARKITHKNVCRMYDLNKDGRTYYITMEYVSGEDLKSTLRRVGPLSPGKAVYIAKQVCEGLAEAHKLGVVHRDLKPQNIMIDMDGNARIMDFGIARSLEAKGKTETGMMIGTPEYMSPEQAEGKEADQRSDIYSLGVIIYEMLTGKVPFEGDTALSIIVQHRWEPPPDPRELIDLIPEDLSQVILKCMEKDKEKRYQNAAELLSELDNIERSLPATDKVLPKGKTWLKSSKKTIKPLLIPGILFVASIIAVAGYLFLDGKSQPERKEEAEKAAVIPGKPSQNTEAMTLQFGQLEIKSMPEGAEVFFGKEREGITPLKRELSPGTYEIKLKKSPDYKEFSDVVDVKEGEISVKNYTLIPVSKILPNKSVPNKVPVYTLRINSTPDGADVSIDGENKGKTPIRIDLPRNRCQLKIVRGERWSTIDESLSLRPGLNTFHWDLKRIKHSLTIRTNPSGADVLIDNEPFGTTPVNKLVSIGTHNIKIEMQGYKRIEETIHIDSDIAKTYDLVKPKTGKIRIKVQPYADVLIDGKLIGEVPSIRIQEVMEGKHTIEFVSTRQNRKFAVEVEIGPGENKEIRMNMDTGEHRIVKLTTIQ